jgi:hypothetical protein
MKVNGNGVAGAISSDNAVFVLSDKHAVNLTPSDLHRLLYMAANTKYYYLYQAK